MKTAKTILMAISLMLMTAQVQADHDKQEVVPAKQVMNDIYAALRAILPYSLFEKKFEDPKVKESISKHLKTLADKASILPEHTEFHDATFRYLGASLARDAKDMYRRFELGHTREALYLFNSMTDNCVACHSRLPAQQSTKAAHLFSDVDAGSLMLDEKARLYLITRQFDKSIKTYKELLLSDEYRTEDICMADWINDYLVIAIRVKRDFNDAKDTLVKFQRRINLPMYAQHDLRAWIESIDKLAKRKDTKPTMANIRKLLDEAKTQVEFPMDRQGQVYYLLASSLLHEYVMSNPKGTPAAEAYYLLGLTETMTGRSSWLSQNEYYLETAIRSSPASSFAEKAYGQLEEQILFEYSGSSGTNVPEESKDLLDELRRLIMTAKGKHAK